MKKIFLNYLTQWEILKSSTGRHLNQKNLESLF